MGKLNNRLDTTIDLAACYDAILKDVASCYPQDQLEWARDSKRVHQQSSVRGQPFFTVELPRLGKQLDVSLSRGRLALDGVAHSRGRNPVSKIPRLFQGLWARIFTDDGYLREDADSTAVYFLRTLLMCCKKLKVDAPRSTLYEKIKEFYHAEESTPPVPREWDDEAPFLGNNLGHLGDLDSSWVWSLSRPDPREGGDSRLLSSIQNISDRVAAEIGIIDADVLCGRHGPGAVSELPASKFKYDFDLWSPNLEAFFPFDRHAVANLSLVQDVLTGKDVPLIEEGSRLIPVPKDQRGPRLIAAEPNCHQWIQQALSRELRLRVAKTIIGQTIDFFDQRPSQVLALEASASGSLATVDLKSASDNLSCYVVQRMFRRNLTLLNLLRACRTRFLKNSVDLKEQSVLRLRKFATMGSALTFPLQSIVFATICLGVGVYLNPRRSLRSLVKEVRVFGDDIVVPGHWVPALGRALALLKLEINTSKTFSEGNFRESCGVDAFRGVDVTPPYLKCPRQAARNHADVASNLDVSNNFYLKGFWNTSDYLARTDPQVRKFPVVHLSARTPGLLTVQKGNYDDLHRLLYEQPRGYSSGTRDHHSDHLQSLRRALKALRGVVAVRWNRHLTRYEFRVPSLSRRIGRETRYPDGAALLLEWFTQKRERSMESIDSGDTSHLCSDFAENSRLRFDRLRVLDLFRSRLGNLSVRTRESSGAAGQVLKSLAWVPIDYLIDRPWVW